VQSDLSAVTTTGFLQTICQDNEIDLLGASPSEFVLHTSAVRVIQAFFYVNRKRHGECSPAVSRVSQNKDSQT
jgi:hypothetical protein